MKFRILTSCLLALLLLAACSRQLPPTQDTEPTLPSFSQEKTPLELLTEAVEKSKNTPSATVRYGTVTHQGEQKQEQIHAQSVSADCPLNLDAIRADLPDFPTNENCLADFCAGRIRVIPSNDGTFRYELPELTWDALWALMHGPSTPDDRYGDYTQILCTAAIDIDPQGRISRLEFITELFSEAQQPERTVTVFLSVDYGA